MTATHLGTWGGRMLTLTHWVDARDQVRTGPAPEFEVDEDSVVTLADTANWSSHQAACEPWTGNEGGVAEKWFHAATLVLVPPDADARPEPAPPRPGVLRGVLEPGDRDGNGRRVLRRGRA